MSYPQPGYYRLRLVSRGPWVPAIVYVNCPLMPADYEYPPEEWMAPLDRSRFLTMEIDGVEVGEEDFAYRWGGCRPISREDYDLMREQAAWDRENEPGSPLANPTRVLKISDLPEHLRDQAKAERSYWSQKEREYREQAASNWKEIRDAQ